MFKLRYSVILLVIMSLFVGCSHVQPSCNTKDTMQVQTLDGKSFTVPKGTIYTREAVTEKVIQFYHKIGIESCKVGDITWEEAKTSEMINTILRSGTKEDGIALYKKAAREGKIGCASPNKE